MPQTLTQYGQKLEQVQRGKNWQQATKAVKQASSSGELPETFGHVADVCEQSFQQLNPSQQKTLEDVSVETRQAIYMLAASFSTGENDRNHVDAVSDLIGNMGKNISGGISGSGSTR